MTCSYLLHLVWHHSHFQTAQKNSIRMTSHPCNKYEQIMLSYLLRVKHCVTFQIKLCIWKLRQPSSPWSGRKNIDTNTQQSRFSVVRINGCSFSLELISYIIMPGFHSNSEAVKAKFLLSALHVHDSCFKMLAKKFFLSTKLSLVEAKVPKRPKQIHLCITVIS